MSARFAASSRALFTDLQDGTSVLLHLDSKAYFELNETATFIWNTIASRGPLSVSEIASAAAQTFEIAPDMAETHIQTLLAALAAEALVDTTEAPR